MPSAEPQPRRTSSPRKRGRSIAVAVYYGILASVCIVATVQLSRQAYFETPLPSPWSTCRDGLRALVGAVDRARKAAPGTDGEDAALERFRAALEPAWGHVDGVAAACKGSEKDEGALDAIERLRYAEEHAVRREAGDLAPLRRRVQAIIENELAPGRSTSQGP